MERRTLIHRLGTVAALGAVAGCLDDGTTGDPGAGDEDDGTGDEDDGTGDEDGGTGDEDDGTGDDGDENDGGGEESSVTDSNVETTETDCGDGNDAEVEFEDAEVVVTGHIEAATPCHEATLEEATIDEGTLDVEVGLEEDLEEDEVCMECIGRIDYEADVEFDGDGPDEVVVSHRAHDDHVEVTTETR